MNWVKLLTALLKFIRQNPEIVDDAIQAILLIKVKIEAANKDRDT